MDALVFTHSMPSFLTSEAPPTKFVQERFCSRYTQLSQTQATMKHTSTLQPPSGRLRAQYRSPLKLSSTLFETTQLCTISTASKSQPQPKV